MVDVTMESDENLRIAWQTAAPQVDIINIEYVCHPEEEDYRKVY